MTIEQNPSVFDPITHRRIRFDNTVLKDFRACAMRGFLRYQRHLVPASYVGHPKPIALVFGTWIHSALAVYYRTKDLTQAQNIIIDGFGPMYEEAGYDDKTRTPDRALDMILAYAKHWATATMEMELVCSELFFEFPLFIHTLPDGTQEQIYYCGKIDEVLRHKGKIVGMDHKTTWSLSSAFIESMRISQQFLGYVMWLKRHSGWSEDWSGYFYPDFLLTAKSSSRGDGGMPFYRETLLCDDEMLDDWLVDAVSQVKLYKEYEDGTRMPVKNTDACNDYNRLCMYFYGCSAVPEMRESHWQTAFIEEPWEPGRLDEDAT